MTPIIAMSRKSLSICYAPDSREVVDLPRIYIHHDSGSTSLDQEAKIQESSDPAWGQPTDNGSHAQKQWSLVITGKFPGAQAYRMSAAEVFLWVWLLCFTWCSHRRWMWHGDLYNLNINGTVRNWAVYGSWTWKSNDLIMWPLEVEILE